MEHTIGVGPKILVEIDANGEFVDPNCHGMRYFLSPLAHQSRYIPLEYSNWKKVPDDEKNEA